MNCVMNKKSKQYYADFDSSNHKKYQLILKDFIPTGKEIRLNPFYHEFIENENFIQINVKQKYDSNYHPEEIEVELIEACNLTKGSILTLQETNTNDIFKMKVDFVDGEIGKVDLINLKKLNMVIRSIPHYYNKYVIENWILFKI